MNRAGLFLPKVQLGSMLQKDDVIGIVIQPSSGEVLERIVAPFASKVIALLNQPVVTPGSMVARLVSEADIEGDWDAYF